METYANQKIILVMNEYEDKFLSSGFEEWTKASQYLTYNSFKMYLYFASCRDGETVRLRYADINRVLPMSKQGYHKSVKELKDTGHLVHIFGDKWLFGMTPHRFAYEDAAEYIRDIFDEE